MKINIQRADERGKGEYEWLHTRYSFSFANYHNPKRMGFGKLRVLNDDIIEPGKGFGEHEHDNMEIVTIVLEGALEHKDSTGGQGIIKAGEVQRMSAGTGVTHSEFNASREKVHLFQIWIDANSEREPGYEQKTVVLQKNKFVKIVSNNDNKALSIGQDAEFLIGELDKGKHIDFSFKKGHGLYLFVIEGAVAIGDHRLDKADAAEISDTSWVRILPKAAAKVLLITVPMQ